MHNVNLPRDIKLVIYLLSCPLLHIFLLFILFIYFSASSAYLLQIYRGKHPYFIRQAIAYIDLYIASGPSWNSSTKGMPASMIAAHPDDARNYPIDMCWSRKGIKGRRAVREHHVLSRLFDHREASFDRVRADKNEQCTPAILPTTRKCCVLCGTRYTRHVMFTYHWETCEKVKQAIKRTEIKYDKVQWRACDSKAARQVVLTR